MKGVTNLANKLKNLKLTSVDLVDNGANPLAHVRLFKRDKKDNGGVAKDAMTFNDGVQMEILHKVAREMFDFTYMFSDSLASILFDEDLDETAKRDMMFKSFDEFAETIRASVPGWCVGKCLEKDISKKGTIVPKGPNAKTQTAFEAFWKGLTADTIVNPIGFDSANPADNPANSANDSGIPKNDTTGPNPTGDTVVSKPVDKGIDIPPKEEMDMKFDKSKMTPEEQAQLADFEKRYGLKNDPANPIGFAPAPAAVPDIHPDVKKALAEFEEIKKAQAAEIAKQKDELETLRKRVEMEQLTGFAKKYEIIGKKSDELAAKLYDLKKAGGTAYDDYVALLDEHLATVEKSGLFKEFGKNTSGSGDINDRVNMAVADVKKNNAAMTTAQALIKAFEDNPELAAQYDKEYMGGK